MNDTEIIYRNIGDDKLRRILGRISKNQVKPDITCKKRPWSKLFNELSLQEKLILKNPSLTIQLKTNK